VSSDAGLPCRHAAALPELRTAGPGAAGLVSRVGLVLPGVCDGAGGTSAILGIMRRETETVYIAYIEISARMVEKLGSSRGITEDEVRDTFQLPGKPQRGVWHEHPEYGRLLYVRGKTEEGRHMLAILQPVGMHDDHWRLRTAWHVDP
jgi:hypothetical protein